MWFNFTYIDPADYRSLFPYSNRSIFRTRTAFFSYPYRAFNLLKKPLSNSTRKRTLTVLFSVFEHYNFSFSTGTKKSSQTMLFSLLELNSFFKESYYFRYSNHTFFLTRIILVSVLQPHLFQFSYCTILRNQIVRFSFIEFFNLKNFLNKL